MLTVNDIINAAFRKAGFSGYKTEDVDAFLDQVKDTFEEMQKENIEQKEQYEKLRQENEGLQDKLEVLAAKIEEYRSEGALVSAQKLGDASIREARHKAEIIVKDANLKAENIIASAKQDVVEYTIEFEKLKKTVSDFRSKLLDTYKEHLTLINALPVQKQEAPKTEAAPAAPQKSAASEEPQQEDSRPELINQPAPDADYAQEEFHVKAPVPFEKPEEAVENIDEYESSDESPADFFHPNK